MATYYDKRRTPNRKDYEPYKEPKIRWVNTIGYWVGKIAFYCMLACFIAAATAFIYNVFFVC